MPVECPQIEQAVAEIRRRWSHVPRAGLILGTGLGQVAHHIADRVALAYRDIPNFPCSTAPGHEGRLVCGLLAGVAVVAMEGRLHFYEGYSFEHVTLPVQVMHRLGVELLIVGNAAGGLNPTFVRGDVMVIDSHINLMGRAMRDPAWAGPYGRAAPSAPSPYDVAMIERSLELARRENFVAQRGVYVAVTGPNYETRSEYRLFRRIGGDAVGMSTAPEASVAARLGMRVLGLSAITNIARPDAPSKTSAAEVLATAEQAASKFHRLTLGILAGEPSSPRRCSGREETHVVP